MVKESLFEYMMSGPIVAIVIQGIHAIDMVRKLAGHTLPFKAEMGTVRGDYSVDSPAIANIEQRAIHNIMHASETPEEAQNEIGLWFKPEEIHSYKRAEEDIMF
jgi:nucleoside-diphosphate kinase